MADQPKLIPVEQATRLQAQMDALQKLRTSKQAKMGRPTVVDDNVTANLIAAFQSGMNVVTACHYARISTDAFYKRCKNDQDFSDIMQDARDFLKLRSGERVKTIILSGEDKTAGPLAWKVMETQLPDLYGRQNIVNNDNRTQNITLLSNEQISNIGRQSDISEADPTELLEALEASSNVDTRTEEESAAQVHRAELPHIDSNEVDLPQPQRTI